MKFSKHVIFDHSGLEQQLLSRFIKNSFWKYAIAAVLVTLIRPNLFLHPVITFLVFWLGLGIMSFVMAYIGAQRIKSRTSIDAIIDFDEDGLNYKDNNSNSDERWSWQQFKEIQILEEEIRIFLDNISPYVIRMPKNLFDKAQISYFEKKQLEVYHFHEDQHNV